MEKEPKKEPYVTPEITSEDVIPGALASTGSPLNNSECDPIVNECGSIL